MNVSPFQERAKNYRSIYAVAEVLKMVSSGASDEARSLIHTRHYWRVKRLAFKTLLLHDFFPHLRELDNEIRHLQKKIHQKIKNRTKTGSCELREPVSKTSITWGSRLSP